jgi:hypothetical protein
MGTCTDLTEQYLINRYNKPYIEEEGSSDENDLENALQHIEIFSIETYYLNRIFYLDIHIV